MLKNLGADILDKVAFAQDDMEIDMILKENCGSEVAKLFFDISDLMDKELDEKYDHSKFGGLFGPIKKAKAYSKIDYSNIYEKINDFEEKNKSATDNPQNQFIEDIRGDVLPEMDREANIGDTIGDAGENDIHL